MKTEVYQTVTSELALTPDGAAVPARLNHAGNWLTSIERPLEGIPLHKKALALFEDAQDQHGTAVTLSALGNSYIALGNIEQAVLAYRKAAILFRALNDRTGLSFVLSMLAGCGPHYLNSIAKWGGQDLAHCILNGEEALTLAQDAGWRSGEALALINLGLALSLPGQYGRALQDVRRGLQIATELEHLQLQVLAYTVIGAIHLDILCLDLAQAYLEKASKLSRKDRSNPWHLILLGLLVPTYILQGDLFRAETMLATFSTNTPMETVKQRQVWFAAAKLNLAQGNTNSALKIVERLIRSVSSSAEKTNYSLSRLVKLYGEILITLGKDDEASTTLELGLKNAKNQGAQSLVWRFHILLGQLYWQRRYYSKSERHYVAARRLIEKLSNTIPDTFLRETFFRRASTLIPGRATRRAGKRPFGGLTKREYEIATLIAQRKSNQEIAAGLFMSRSGVEKHVKNILTKLGFNSRLQIEDWVTNRQVAKSSKV